MNEKYNRLLECLRELRTINDKYMSHREAVKAEHAMPHEYLNALNGLISEGLELERELWEQLERLAKDKQT